MKLTKKWILALLELVILSNLLSCSIKRKIAIAIPNLMAKDSLKLDFDSDCPDKRKLKVEKNVVEFMLFEEFDDTLSMYVNNKQVKDWAIYTKNNPFTSTGFSGISFKLSLKNKNNLIRFQLAEKHKYVEFDIDKHYPLYTIQLYQNIWYVNGRRCSMELK